MGAGTCLFALAFFLFKTADVVALFKTEFILESVTNDLNVHIFGRVLGSAGTKSVGTKRVLVVVARVIVVLAACVKFAVNKFPVIAFFTLVVIHGTASSEILYLNGIIKILGNDDLIAVTLAGFVYGV